MRANLRPCGLLSRVQHLAARFRDGLGALESRSASLRLSQSNSGQKSRCAFSRVGDAIRATQCRSRLPLFFCTGTSVGEDPASGWPTLSPANARSLHGGLLMARILTVLKTPGVSGGVSSATDAASVHANWEQVLLPALETSYGLFLSPKQRALLWAGDGDTLAWLLEHLYSRVTGEPLDDGSGGGAKPGFFDADALEQATALIAQASALYGAVLASLLAVFVPQMCPANPPKYNELHECTIAVRFLCVGRELCVAAF
jgi:hypothetical protein